MSAHLDFWSSQVKALTAIIVSLLGYIGLYQSNRIKAIEERVGGRVQKDMCELQHKTVDATLKEIKEEMKEGMTGIHKRLDKKFDGDRRGVEGQ